MQNEEIWIMFVPVWLHVYIYILCFFVVNTLGYGVLVLNHVKGGAQYLF